MPSIDPRDEVLKCLAASGVTGSRAELLCSRILNRMSRKGLQVRNRVDSHKSLPAQLAECGNRDSFRQVFAKTLVSLLFKAGSDARDEHIGACTYYRDVYDETAACQVIYKYKGNKVKVLTVDKLKSALYPNGSAELMFKTGDHIVLEEGLE